MNDAALPEWMQTAEIRQAMSTLKEFSEKERAYHAYQARQNYLREQRSIQRHLDLMRAETERQRVELEQQRAEAEQERNAKEAALAEVERLRRLGNNRDSILNSLATEACKQVALERVQAPLQPYQFRST